MKYDIALQAAHAARRAGFLTGWNVSAIPASTRQIESC